MTEIANGLVTGMRRGRLTAEDVELFLEAISLVDLRIEAPTSATATLIEFAHATGLTAYDAEYVLLARERDLPLATNDKRMREAAIRVGVSVVETA